MLQDLFNNSKLEYINILNVNNIVESMTIKHNIENLRCFYVINHASIDITLDISQEYPKKL